MTLLTKRKRGHECLLLARGRNLISAASTNPHLLPFPSSALLKENPRFVAETKLHNPVTTMDVYSVAEMVFFTFLSFCIFVFLYFLSFCLFVAQSHSGSDDGCLFSCGDGEKRGLAPNQMCQNHLTSNGSDICTNPQIF